MSFDQSKLAGSKNIILNTCGETCNVVSKAHWRRDNIISLRNQNHFGANTNGLSFLLKQFIKCQYWTNETVRFFWIYKGATFNEETHQKNALKLRINLGNALYPRYFNLPWSHMTSQFDFIISLMVACFALDHVCHPNPCVNGGSCQVENNTGHQRWTFKCECPRGFIGKLCHSM